MAASASYEALVDTLSWRLTDLSTCRLVTADQWSSLFATISVSIAKRFRDARCFLNDTAVINPDWNFHKNQRREFLTVNSLRMRTEQALKCLPPQERAGFFAEVSVAIASTLVR